jgi:hypothetical protein
MLGSRAQKQLLKKPALVNPLFRFGPQNNYLMQTLHLKRHFRLNLH